MVVCKKVDGHYAMIPGSKVYHRLVYWNPRIGVTACGREAERSTWRESRPPGKKMCKGCRRR